jgi:hypothetical protein
MRERAEGRRVSVWMALAALVIAWGAGLFGCRDPRADDGAGGQSGDEGRRPRATGVGGSGAQPQQPS